MQENFFQACMSCKRFKSYYYCSYFTLCSLISSIMSGLSEIFDMFEVSFNVSKLNTSFCHQYIFVRTYYEKFSID